MDLEVQLIIALVIDLEVAERHVADRHIEEVIREAGIFIALNGDVVLLVQLTGDAAGQVVLLNTVDLALRHGGGQSAGEGAGAAAGVEDIALGEAQVAQDAVNGVCYLYRRIEGR